MRVRNYAAKPMAEITSSKRIDTNIWDIRGFDKSMLMNGFTLRCDATLKEPPGIIRIGWSPTPYQASQRIAGNIFNKECLLPLVTFVIQSGTWTMTRLLATPAREDAIIRAIGLDYFDAGTAPY